MLPIFSELISKNSKNNMKTRQYKLFAGKHSLFFTFSGISIIILIVPYYLCWQTFFFFVQLIFVNVMVKNLILLT